MTIITAAEREERYAAAGLDDRDILVLRLVARGFQDKQVADEMGISMAAARSALARVCRKIGVSGRVSAAMWLFGVEVTP